jgi:subtilisin family serine protease
MAGLAALSALGCAGGSSVVTVPAPVMESVPSEIATPADRTAVTPADPALPPRIAMFAGLMPLRTIGVDAFRVAAPEYDGRGVLIAILDSGVDPSLPGLRSTTTTERKLLDIRDFSGEGRIALQPVRPGADGTVRIGEHVAHGFGRVAGIASSPYYGGVFHEVTLGAPPAADVNRSGTITDAFLIVVARASDAWVAIVDTDGDRSLEDERPIRDYGIAGDVFTFRDDGGQPGPIAVAVNLSEAEGRPVLDLVLDNSSHGSHVAGIAAGHDLFGVEGFHGVAPGAQLLALKIANNTRGGISVTGSMLSAMQYAADYAARRSMPLIVNLSYGVGNEVEGGAAIDSLIDAYALQHPNVLVVISAGNDGPGVSTVGLPGSAEHALTVCALFPGAFIQAPQPGTPPAADVMGWWSARGGEVAKPDVCAPGVAYSNVPEWRTGEEISGGTSMAAPVIAGAAALLQSAMLQSGGAVRAIDLKRSLMATATPMGGTTVLDEGAGVPNVGDALRWLRAAHQTGIYRVRALTSEGTAAPTSAAYRRGGLASPADTIQEFVVSSAEGQPAARLLLEPDVPWLRAPALIEPGGEATTIRLTYDAGALTEPGLYVGTVWARPASDTISGPSFGLTNTVVVPQSLDTAFGAQGLLTPGATARYFLQVPAAAGGLEVVIDLGERGGEATLYLFEPSGQPYRGGNSAAAGGTKPSRAAVTVMADEVVPGVYEAVVVAPPTKAVSYRFTASVPSVRVETVAVGPVAVVENLTDVPQRVAISAVVLGGVRFDDVRGDERGDPTSIEVTVPEWATSMTLDASLPRDLWQSLTDFGVTVFDSLGRKISDSPLNYAFGRHRIVLDTADRGATLRVELFPAFARGDAARSWSASLRTEFLAEAAIELPLVGDTVASKRYLTARERLRVPISPPDMPLLPIGYDYLIEVVATPETGPASVRRAAVEP